MGVTIVSSVLLHWLATLIAIVVVSSSANFIIALSSLLFLLLLNLLLLCILFCPSWRHSLRSNLRRSHDIDAHENFHL